MTDRDKELAAGAALGALSAEEAARADEEARRSTAFAADLEDYRATVTALDSGVAREPAPPDLFEGVLAQIDAERAVEEVSERESPPSRESRRTRRLLPAFAIGLAAAAITVAVALVLTSGDDLGPPDARASVQGTPAFAAVRGEAMVYAASSDDGVLKLDLADVPLPAAGEHYEVWVLRDAGDGEMEAVGVFRPTGHDVALELRLPGPGTYEAVDVSIEPDGGPAAHSGQSLAGGRFERVAT
jgi:anti-sigma-K factor RskA